MITQDELSDWILIALGELDGSARRDRVLRVMEGSLGGRLTADDHAPRTNGEAAWRNNASFARKELVAEKLLLSTAQAGHGMWTLTPRGARRSRALRSRQDASLCPAFRSIAARVAWSTTAGRSVGLVPVEPTFTDNALLKLATQHRDRVKIQRFTAHEEAQNGADWEWWIRDHHRYTGFRIQAKRANPRTGRVALDQPAAGGAPFDKQVEAFVNRCRADGVPGLYCVYSDWQPRSAGISGPGPCPHGPADAAQWGCTVLLAETAHRLATWKRCDAETVLAAGMPWYHLVCDPSESLIVGVHRVFKRLMEPEIAIRGDNDQAPWRDFLPPATQPPSQVTAFFEQGAQVLEPWSDIAGVVLINASSAGASSITDS
ncbi:hypothetical protein [Paractinoplanes hotanensis]|uniref:Uncharacterized protein n=1 Tax=Paractinoplanes hotanensis TaxID=2906497 RepID=A0ABT0YBW8_9ACTN|nr:hypothetical protein [Actinoplanes hotanensis]MCM4083551.1 hypothetical protein [Actinoplanes hotanensis]